MTPIVVAEQIDMDKDVSINSGNDLLMYLMRYIGKAWAKVQLPEGIIKNLCGEPSTAFEKTKPLTWEPRNEGQNMTLAAVPDINSPLRVRAYLVFEQAQIFICFECETPEGNTVPVQRISIADLNQPEVEIDPLAPAPVVPSPAPVEPEPADVGIAPTI